MRFLLMIYGNDTTWDSWTDQDRQEVAEAHRLLLRDLTESGELIGSEGLTTIGARTVRVSAGLPIVTDGPFTEAKEVLAGYYLVDCAGFDRATEIAARLPEARFDPIEIRALMDQDQTDRFDQDSAPSGG